jgi:hypothetical protein
MDLLKGLFRLPLPCERILVLAVKGKYENRYPFMISDFDESCCTAWLDPTQQMNRCPVGLRPQGLACVNEEECRWWRPCLNGGECIDYADSRRFACRCTGGYTGRHCELELLSSGALMPSNEFIIAIVACIIALLSKYMFGLFIFFILVFLCSEIFFNSSVL